MLPSQMQGGVQRAVPCVCCPVRCGQGRSEPCPVSAAWSDAGRDAASRALCLLPGQMRAGTQRAVPCVCCPVRCRQGRSKPCPVSAGTFGECSSEAEVQSWMRYNTFLLLEVGTFNALVELLNMEIE